MTNREALEAIERFRSLAHGHAVLAEALDMAIKALSAQPEQNCVLTVWGECSYAETGCSECQIKAKITTALSCSESPNRSDTIYRQDAMDFIQSLYPSAPIMRLGRELWKEKYKTYIEIEKALEMLPSATKLEAKELQDVKVERDYWKQRAKYAERPKGEWIDLDEYQIMDWMSKNKCSICGKITFGELKNYCPNCGADMRKGKSDG